jgi:hypothetical protein
MDKQSSQLPGGRVGILPETNVVAARKGFFFKWGLPAERPLAGNVLPR